MDTSEAKSDLSCQIKSFLKEDFRHNFGPIRNTFPNNETWGRFKKLGTELWLDTGNMEDAGQIWTQEFSALTTNNTLLNKEVQKGNYDALILKANMLLSKHPELTEKQRILEIAFILNAKHGLRLVEQFDAHVSVEEHTDLAHDLDGAVECARRYYEICPERFIIKIPFTPAGLLATRRLTADGIPVNHTLGFSARQNYVIARIGRPAYVNIFLGRLNSFVLKNNLGTGDYVGEKATLASQATIKKLRSEGLTESRQIGASFREGKQICDLAGIDVMTIPPEVARDFLSIKNDASEIIDKTGSNYKIGLNKDVDPDRIRLNTLWQVDEKIVRCVNSFDGEDLDLFTPNDLVNFFKDHGCEDLFIEWDDSQITTSITEGKIPLLENWNDALADGSIGLDSLMNLAGLCSFEVDQKAMDERIRQKIKKTDFN